MKRGWIALLTLLAWPAWADDGEWQVWVGLRSATLGSFAQETLTQGYQLGIKRDQPVLPWLSLRLAAERAEAEFVEAVPRGGAAEADPGTALGQTVLRLGLRPRLQAGPALLAVGAEWLRLDSSATGESARLFGQGRRQHQGYGLGGTSRLPLGERLFLIGEAAGYRLGELEWVEAGMRLDWQPASRRLRALRFHLEGVERRISSTREDLREVDLRVGVGRRF